MKQINKPLFNLFKKNLKVISKKISVSKKKTEKFNLSIYLMNIKQMELNQFKNLEENSEFFTKYKKVPKQAIDYFFTKYKANKIDYSKRKDNGYINNGYFKIKVYAITPSVLGSVRIINDLKTLKRYIKIKYNFYKLIQSHKFKHFDILPVDILGVRKIKEDKYAMLERIIPAISIEDISEFRDHNFDKSELISKYSPIFLRTLKKIGITDFKSKENIKKFNKLYKKLNAAYIEYYSYFVENNLHYFDFYQGNVLFVDYNQKTDRFLLAPIDFYGTHTKSVI